MALDWFLARRDARGDAGASDKHRNDARDQSNATSGRLLGLSGGVEALDRCASIALRTSPSRKTRSSRSYRFLSSILGINQPFTKTADCLAQASSFMT